MQGAKGALDVISLQVSDTLSKVERQSHALFQAISSINDDIGESHAALLRDCQDEARTSYRTAAYAHLKAVGIEATALDGDKPLSVERTSTKVAASLTKVVADFGRLGASFEEEPEGLAYFATQDNVGARRERGPSSSLMGQAEGKPSMQQIRAKGGKAQHLQTSRALIAECIEDFAAIRCRVSNVLGLIEVGAATVLPAIEQASRGARPSVEENFGEIGRAIREDFATLYSKTLEGRLLPALDWKDAAGLFRSLYSETAGQLGGASRALYEHSMGAILVAILSLVSGATLAFAILFDRPKLGIVYVAAPPRHSHLAVLPPLGASERATSCLCKMCLLT